MTTKQIRSDRVVLEANLDHWNRERGPRLEKVIFRNDLTQQEALDLVCNGEGEVDIVTEVTADQAQQVLDSKYANLATVDAMRMLTGIINRAQTDAPLYDVRVRRALNLAVDRDKLINGALKGYAHPMAALTPPYADGLPSGLEPYAHDPEEAKRLLHEAGWPAGRPLKLAASPAFEGIAQLLADDFRNDLGIEVTVHVIPHEEDQREERIIIEKVVVPDFDVRVYAWFDLTSDAPPAVMHREFFHSTGAFRVGPVDERVEELFGRFVAQIKPGKLAEVAAEIDRHVYDEALALFLCAPQALYAVNKHVSFQGHAATFELAETEVDESHWSRRGTP